MPYFGSLIKSFRKHVEAEKARRAEHPEWHYTHCSKCGCSLCKETDSYRFTANGDPICYDCDED